MGALQKFERRLGDLVEGAFAKVFKGQVEPVEVAAALQREAGQSAAIVAAGRTLVHNHYTVELGHSDAARLLPYADALCSEFAAMVREHASESGWSFPGPVEVVLTEVEGLDTGIFRVRSKVTTPAVPPTPPSAGVAAEHPARPVVRGATSGAAGTSDVAAGGRAGQPSRRAGNPRLVLGQGGAALVGTAAADDAAETVVDLIGSVTVIGRGTDVDLQLHDNGISRRHAEVRVEGEHLVLVDLGSTNGSTVNGQQVDRHPLRDGDRIELGRTTLLFHRDAEADQPRPESEARDGFDRVDGA